MAKKAAKKKPAVTIKIIGSLQAAAITDAFDAKRAVKVATDKYETARETANPVMLSKVLGHWGKIRSVNTGVYDFILPDDQSEQVVVQNRQSTKSYDPADAKDTLAKLNEDTKPDAQLRMADIFMIKKIFTLNEDAMKIPKVLDRVLDMLTALESELKEDRTLPPEGVIIEQDQKLMLAKHALDRIVALNSDCEKAIKIVGNPVTINFVDTVDE